MCISIGRFLYRHTKFRSTSIRHGRIRLRLYIADTLIKQSIGLMYKRSLPRNTGMLFVLRRESALGIWMLNMRFSIDILWLDRSGAVMHIVENAEPCASVFSCHVYRPHKPAKYVLELGAGRAKSLGIRKGSRLLMP